MSEVRSTTRSFTELSCNLMVSSCHLPEQPVVLDVAIQDILPLLFALTA